jgi:hypothetical protein
MKTIKLKCLNISLAAMLFAAASYTAVGHEYRKDMRPQAEKEDGLGMYQVDRITTFHLVKALEIAGVRIFVFPLKPFDKKYKLDIYLHEYVNGKIVKTDNLYNFRIDNDNTYTHSGGEKYTLGGTYYTDYIDHITFYTKDGDSVATGSLSTYTLQNNNIKLQKKITREKQFYNWRSYSQTDWKIGEEIPLLIYASSWWDEKWELDRFCGVVDLSRDEKGTQELLESSLHYFVFTYKVYEE